MGSLDWARRRWREASGEDETPLDGDTPAWVMSLVLHVGVLLSMALFVVPRPTQEAQRPITITPPDEAVEDDVFLVPEEMTVSDERQENTGAESEESLEIATALAPLLAEESVVPIEADAMETDVTLEPIDALPTGLEVDANLVVKGDVGVGTQGAAGAVDRLTLEIAASLEQRPTIICWVFDQSVSLSGQRKEIAARLDRVFDELGVTGSAARRPDLVNLVFAYGQRVTPVLPNPTREGQEVIEAIESIPVDDSGVENTFTAIADAAARCRQVRAGETRKNVMIITFTDEVGNDQKYADQVAAFCRQQAMRVYVVGVPAPFGMRDVRMKFVEFDPKYADEVQWAVVEQGPETLYPEVVRVRTGADADEPIDSGFGPFSLSKLCAETGGIYFCVHANRNDGGRVAASATAPMSSQLRYFFSSDAMRNYRPDYVNAAKIEQMLSQNAAKKALVTAARSAEVSPLEAPRMSFPRRDDGALAGLFAEAQKKAAVLSPKLDALYQTLAAGLNARDAIKEKRWQAGYDLALGRVAAHKVRIDAYNITLAQAKTGMKFKNPNSDTWVLEPSDDVSAVGSQTEKLAKQAKELLERVVKDHPGTPWALIAGEELKTPLGYVWTETHTGVNRPMDGGGGGNAQPQDDARRNLAPPKPKRPLKNL